MMTKTNKKYLIFDIETTRSPINYSPSVQDSYNWPRILQISWELCYDHDGVIIEKLDNSFIHTPGWYFPTPSIEKQREAYSWNYSFESGKNALFRLAIAMLYADVIICYDVKSVYAVIRAEMSRYDINLKTIRKHLFKTRNIGGVNHLTLRPEGVKLQKYCIAKMTGHLYSPLQTVYESIFDKPLNGTYSKNMVDAIKEIYFKIINT